VSGIREQRKTVRCKSTGDLDGENGERESEDTEQSSRMRVSG